MGGAVSSQHLASGQTMVGVMAVMVASFKRTCWHTVAPGLLYSVPQPHSRPQSTQALDRDSEHSQTSLAQSLLGSLLLSPGSRCAQDFLCALQHSVSPVLWKFYNHIPLDFKVKFPRGSQFLCQIRRFGNLFQAL